MERLPNPFRGEMMRTFNHVVSAAEQRLFLERQQLADSFDFEERCFFLLGLDALPRPKQLLLLYEELLERGILEHVFAESHTRTAVTICTRRSSFPLPFRRPTLDASISTLFTAIIEQLEAHVMFSSTFRRMGISLMTESSENSEDATELEPETEVSEAQELASLSHSQ